MAVDDQMAPVGRVEVAELVKSGSLGDKKSVVSRVLSYLNEKRDAYNGLVSTIIYIVDSNDIELVSNLQNGLIELVTSNPMRHGGKMFIARCLPRLVFEQPEFVANLFAQVMTGSTKTWEPNFKDRKEILKVKITALRAISQAEQRTRTKLTDLVQEDIDTICYDATLIADESTKVDTLFLVLDTKATTKIIQDRELEIFKAIFQDALNFQVPALRQKFLAITNKIMKRMRDSIKVVMKNEQRFSSDERETISKRYINFLEWLVQFCLDNIYCNKYFGSFIITLSTLNYIIEHITLDSPHLPIKHLFHNRRFYDSILSCVSLDSFEENKVLALKLLFALPSNEQFITDKNLDLFEEIAYHLVNSVNPAHSLTCQYIFKLVIGFKHRETKARKNRLVYEHLAKLIGLVESGVEETKNNFIVALKSNAIYPKLTCIRALLSEIDVKDLETDRDQWMQLARRIVNAAIEACQAISTIVCNMNPETIGHVPMDLKPIDVDILSKTFDLSVKITENHLQTVTSQHLLITGWKTIKECSLSMAAMCSQLWWPKDDKYLGANEPILDSEAIKMIIEFFKHYLRNLRHRGAFEQAYNGFVLVTKRIWLQQEFRDLLTDSLREVMNDFTSEKEELGDKKVEYLKNHITRRSAGLPFLVQAIVVSEDKLDSKTLRWVMDCLLTILEDSKAETYQKIHCLNILKALMKDYNLGEKVVPFIGRTIVVTIDSFKSDDFPIRNCANMLMRVAVDRVFGVNRLRDDIHKRNTLSFEKFFTEYPDLHSKMLLYLSEGLVDKKALASVHAVFILLFRLRPSVNPSENYTNNKIVRPFITPILELTKTCPDYKLRELAAKLVVQLESYCIDLDNQRGMFLEKVQSLSGQIIGELNSSCVDCNQLHGNLSMFKAWIYRCRTSQFKESLRGEFSDFTEQVVKSIVLTDLYSKLGPACNTIKAVALGIAEIYSLIYPKFKHTWWIDLYPYLEQQLQKASHYRPECQLIFGPHFENLIFKTFSVILTSGCLLGDNDTVGSSRSLSGPNLDRVFELIIDVVTSRPNMVISVNLQAALLRFLRQFFVDSEDFADKLLNNLDLDTTAAIVTPIDQLNQNSELDFEQELWSKFCEQESLRHYIRNNMPESIIERLFDFSNYEEFKSLGKMNRASVTLANTPRGVELLALACKGWNHFNLEQNCIWIEGKNETPNRELKFLTQLIQSLPDCDIKCLAMLCASYLFNSELHRIYKQSTATTNDGDDYDFRASLKSEAIVLREFTEILDELADGQHDRITRETCSELLSSCIKSAVDCWCDCLKDAQMNLLSTLIKLSQDEDFEIRQSSLGALASLNIHHREHDQTLNGQLDSLVVLIATKLLDPLKQEDILDCFNLMTRIIFNHSKNYSVDQRVDRESLFDKTKPNIFADHVASILSALHAAKDFFTRTSEHSGGKIDINLLQLSPEVLAELEIPSIQSQTDNSIGDYSWRLKGAAASHQIAGDQSRSKIDNSTIIDEALVSMKQNLDHFNYRNMLIDTNFGHHESSIFKRLAFVKLLMECTNYNNLKLIHDLQQSLENVVNQSCATTILYKCCELFKDK